MLLNPVVEDHAIGEALRVEGAPEMKPYYQDEWVTLYNADCRDILPAISAHSIITDPPYNMDSVERFFGDSKRHFDPGIANDAHVDPVALARLFVPAVTDNIAVWCAAEQLSAWVQILKTLGLSTRAGVWTKSNPSPMNGEHQFLSGLELCAFGRKPNAFFGGFCEVPSWRGKTQPRSDHPTAKPMWLMHLLIERLLPARERDAIVCDPFAGSGTTLVAAKNLWHRAVGIEIEERYCEIAARRLSQEVLDFGDVA